MGADVGDRRVRLLLVAAVAGLTVWVALTVTRGPSSAAADVVGATEVEVRDRDIRFFEARVTQDPWSAADLTQLAGLYLQRARESGGNDDLLRAEATARRSLALRIGRNGKARLVLASSLLARHRFPEALEEARKLTTAEPDQVSYRALLGEMQLEMGDYDAARATFAALAPARDQLAVAPRLARWAEILGATDAARRVLRAALDEATRRPDLPREQVAWFYLRLGDLELRNGRLGHAARVLRQGLARVPADRRLLGAMARLEAARRRWRRAIDYGERSIALAPDPAIQCLVGDAYHALGDSSLAARSLAAVERAAAENPEPFNRGWTQCRLEHGRALAETLELLRRETTVRRDVYGYDQLAWALYQSGDYSAARIAMQEALRMGTRDAMLYFHAGMIEAALRSRETASRYLKAALEVNPYFHHRFAGVARATLERLITDEDPSLEGAAGL